MDALLVDTLPYVYKPSWEHGKGGHQSTYILLIPGLTLHSCSHRYPLSFSYLIRWYFCRFYSAL